MPSAPERRVLDRPAAEILWPAALWVLPVAERAAALYAEENPTDDRVRAAEARARSSGLHRSCLRASGRRRRNRWHSDPAAEFGIGHRRGARTGVLDASSSSDSNTAVAPVRNARFLDPPPITAPARDAAGSGISSRMNCVPQVELHSTRQGIAGTGEVAVAPVSHRAEPREPRPGRSARRPGAGAQPLVVVLPARPGWRAFPVSIGRSSS